MAVEQIEVNLQAPLDSSKPATIASVSLTPEYASVALNLQADYYLQIKSVISKKLFWSSRTIGPVFLATLGFGYWKSYDLIWDSVDGIFHNSNFVMDLFTVAIFLGFLSSTVVIAFASLTDDFTVMAETMAKNPETVFGFNLLKFSRLNITNKTERKEIAELGENTSIILYRQTPVAAVTVRVVEELCNKDQFVVKITGFDVKKVYVKTGMAADLLDWAVVRARILYSKQNATGSIKVILDNVYNVDSFLIEILKDRDFKLVEETAVPGILGRYYGLSKQLWGCSFKTERDEDNATIATGVEKKNAVKKTKRRA